MGDGEDLPKQYRSIHGTPVLVWTLARLLAEGRIGRIWVAVHPDDPYRQKAQVALDAYARNAAERVRWVAGGAERQDSVLAALDAMAEEPDHTPEQVVLVHDAVRPCLSSASLTAVIDAAVSHDGGALLAVPVRDTLKAEVAHSVGAQVHETVPRDGLWQAQTPQAFPADLLRRALRDAAEQGRTVTDEAQAVEALGGQPRLVSGSLTNVKITHTSDLALVEAWLAGRYPGEA